MKMILWEYRGEIMTEYWGRWFHIGKHFKGVSMWNMSFRFKNSRLWFTTYPWFVTRSHKDNTWKASMLTIRLGIWIITFGKVNQERYYRTCNVISVTENSKTRLVSPKLFKN